MKYVLAPNNTFQRFILPGEVVKFSDRCQTTAKRMTADEAVEYGVSKLQLVSPPAFNPLTQKRTEADPLLVGSVWVQQWALELLDAAGQGAAQAALIDSITTATQDRLDNFAATRDYDSIISATTYATSPTPKFAQEGQYCVQQRDATWVVLATILANVQAGLRPIPKGYAEIEPELPVLVWPV
jgi:hypothetical protein